jgi:chromate reductase
MRVLGISGSLRRDSYNGRLLRAAEALLPPGAELVVFDALKDVAPFDEDDEFAPSAGVLALRAAIADADAILFATPEYNHSIPGHLKNAIDWASRPVSAPVLRGKPAAVVGASAGIFGAVWAQAELRKVLEAAGARVLDRELAVGSAYDAFDEWATLASPEQRAEIEDILAELVAQVAEPVAA